MEARSAIEWIIVLLLLGLAIAIAVSPNLCRPVRRGARRIIEQVFEDEDDKKRKFTT